ncbi:family 16 glycosylhydrolase [Paracidobacterium acidisoli]
MCRRPGNVEATSGGLGLKTLAAQADCRNKSLKWSTGSIQSKANYGYGLYEATMKIADIKGMNNAFWMNTATRPRLKTISRLTSPKSGIPAMITSACRSIRPTRIPA